MKIEMIAAALSNGIFKTLINYCVRQLDHGVGKFKF